MVAASQPKSRWRGWGRGSTRVPRGGPGPGRDAAPRRLPSRRGVSAAAHSRADRRARDPLGHRSLVTRLLLRAAPGHAAVGTPHPGRCRDRRADHAGGGVREYAVPRDDHGRVSLGRARGEAPAQPCEGAHRDRYRRRHCRCVRGTAAHRCRSRRHRRRGARSHWWPHPQRHGMGSTGRTRCSMDPRAARQSARAAGSSGRSEAPADELRRRRRARHRDRARLRRGRRPLARDRAAGRAARGRLAVGGHVGGHLAQARGLDRRPDRRLGPGGRDRAGVRPGHEPTRRAGYRGGRGVPRRRCDGRRRLRQHRRAPPRRH